MTSNLTQYNFISSSSGQKSQMVSLGQNHGGAAFLCSSIYRYLHSLVSGPILQLQSQKQVLISSPPTHFDPPQSHSLNRTHVNILGQLTNPRHIYH